MASNFRQWLKDEVVYLVSPLDRFENKTIGIDAEEYLHSMLTPPEPPEPLLPAHGGNGFTIKKRIDEDLERFRENGIKPWFVFNGLDVANKNVASVMNEGRKAAAVLEEAWKIYDRGQGEDAVVCFGRVCK